MLTDLNTELIFADHNRILQHQIPGSHANWSFTALLLSPHISRITKHSQCTETTHYNSTNGPIATDLHCPALSKYKNHITDHGVFIPQVARNRIPHSSCFEYTCRRYTISVFANEEKRSELACSQNLGLRRLKCPGIHQLILILFSFTEAFMIIIYYPFV